MMCHALCVSAVAAWYDHCLLAHSGVGGSGICRILAVRPMSFGICAEQSLPDMCHTLMQGVRQQLVRIQNLLPADHSTRAGQVHQAHPRWDPNGGSPDPWPASSQHSTCPQTRQLCQPGTSCLPVIKCIATNLPWPMIQCIGLSRL